MTALRFSRGVGVLAALLAIALPAAAGQASDNRQPEAAAPPPILHQETSSARYRASDWPGVVEVWDSLEWELRPPGDTAGPVTNEVLTGKALQVEGESWTWSTEVPSSEDMMTGRDRGHLAINGYGLDPQDWPREHLFLMFGDVAFDIRGVLVTSTSEPNPYKGCPWSADSAKSAGAGDDSSVRTGGNAPRPSNE